MSPIVSIHAARPGHSPRPAPADHRPGPAARTHSRLGSCWKKLSCGCFNFSVWSCCDNSNRQCRTLSAVISCVKVLCRICIQIIAGHQPVLHASEYPSSVKKYVSGSISSSPLKCVIFIAAEYNPWYFLTITVKAVLYL